MQRKQNRRFQNLLVGTLFMALLSCEQSSTAETVAELWKAPPKSTRSASLTQELKAAWQAREEGYVPRTKHVLEDGSPLFVNRLLLETSPYLKQHAHNPVDWRPWGAETLEEARAQRKPIFLSVGYATCHWCHVMEEESFEDLEIAAVLNEGYIAIKVDREERPDVDAIYMRAVRLLKGRGGWPMSVWLTEDATPFYAETYIPARSGDRGREVGFLSLLKELQFEYVANPDEINSQGAKLSRQIQRGLSRPTPGKPPADPLLDQALLKASMQFDPIQGGRTGRPKFPSSFPIPFLLQRAAYGDEKARDMALHSLKMMAAGGIYDHIGGGFHRYSVDAKWLVPHFEKMLYDNAQLASDYLVAGRLDPAAAYTEVARDILDYVNREMTHPEGGFYSATDADSLTPAGHREEGYFFTWTPAELERILGKADAELWMARYGVTKKGNFEGRNILHHRIPLEKLETADGKDALQARMDGMRQRLYQERLQRPPPLLDSKILTAWNGLMISAFSQAGLWLDEPKYIEAAEASARFLLAHMRIDGSLYRSHSGGKTQHVAYIEDHAFLIAGLLDLFEATGKPEWLEEAFGLDAAVLSGYEDKDGGWYRSHKNHSELLVRETPSHDGAEPSGASYMVRNLLRFAALTGEDSYRARADAAFKAYGLILNQSPLALDDMLVSVHWRQNQPKEVIIVADTPKDAEKLLETYRESSCRNRVLVQATSTGQYGPLSELLPPLKGKTTKDGKARAYVCEGGSCQYPTTESDVLRRQLEK
jgi:uncharacterized protein